MTLMKRIVSLVFLVMFVCPGLGVAGTVIVRGDDNDAITIDLGDYTVYGGGGTDTLGLPLFPDEYSFTLSGPNQYTARYHNFTSLFDSIEYVEFGANFKTRLPIAELVSGRSQQQLAKLTDLYLAFFGRAPDVSGLEYWQKRHLEEGRNTTVISMDFSWSDEAKALFPLGADNRDFVKTVYRNCFGRDPDVGGWDYWTNKLNDLNPHDPNYLNLRGAFVGELLLGAYAETSGVEDRSLLINRHEVALTYVNRLSLQPAEGFDPAINSLLALVTMDYATRYNAEHVIDYVFKNAVTLTDVMNTPVLLTSLWTHAPVYDTDDDGDGWSEVQGDCDDSMTTVHPETDDVCRDGIDQDCNGVDATCMVVPNLAGQTQTDASSAILAADLSVGAIVYTPSDTVEAGRVLSQEPSPGTSVPAGTAIHLEVASGPSTDPGDPEQYFPNNLGDTWYYDIRETETGGAPFSDIAKRSVVGSKVVLGQLASVFEQRLLSDNTVIENYFAKKAGGVLNLGNNDPEDPLSPQLIPYWELLFPIQVGQLPLVSKSGLDFGSDLDGDGMNERLDLSLHSSITGVEPVTVPAGAFAAAGKRLSILNGALWLSESGAVVSISGREETWAVAGAGVVKSTTTVTVETESSTTTAEARGYAVNGVGHGLGWPATIADDLSPGNGYLPVPVGNPVVASDGTNFLVMVRKATRTSTEWYAQWDGIVVDPDGTVLKRFQVTPPARVYDFESGEQAALAFDGNSYLFVYERDNNFASSGEWPSLDGVRISPDGDLIGKSAVLAPPGASSPAVAFDGNNYLLVYQYRPQGSGLYQIYGVLISPVTGQVTGVGAFPVTPVPGYQTEPAITFDGTNYLAVWDQMQWPGQAPGVRAARVSQAGAVLDTNGFAVFTPGDLSSLPAAAQAGHPKVAFDGTNFLVVYERWRQNLVIQLFATRISQAGTLLDGSASTGGFPITANIDGYAVDATLTFTGTEYWAAWLSGGMSEASPGGIYGARIGADGKIRSPGTVGMRMGPPAVYVNYPAIAAKASGGYLVWLTPCCANVPYQAAGMPLYPFGP